MTNTVRPTKKQRELLTFIEQFIGEHGYSPSYREIMSGLHYTSVATVALHINNLIKRGHLRKRDHSARSLEITTPTAQGDELAEASAQPREEKWLLDKIEAAFHEIERAEELTAEKVDELYVLIGALRILGLDIAVQNLTPRLNALKERVSR